MTLLATHCTHAVPLELPCWRCAEIIEPVPVDLDPREDPVHALAFRFVGSPE